MKKLTQNEEDRRQATRSLTPTAQMSEGNAVDIQHTTLPVDLVIYERVTPLFMKALGSIGDPNFNPTPIPASQEDLNRLIKKKQHQQLLNGQVYYDKFAVDLALMIGRNLLSLQTSDIIYILRKCYLAMTQRFADNMHFICANQI